MKKLMIILAPFILFITGCKQPENERFVKLVEESHKKGYYLNRPAISFDFELEQIDSPVVAGKYTMLTTLDKIRFERNDGVTLLFDSINIYQAPDTINYPMAKCDIEMWPYLFSIAYKLSDKGVTLTPTPYKTIADQEYHSMQVNFSGKDDYYIIYAAPQSEMIHAVAYNKAFLGSDMNMSQAVVFSDSIEVEKIPFYTTWHFYEWNGDKGLGKLLGKANISNISYGVPAPGFFDKPKNYKIIEK